MTEKRMVTAIYENGVLRPLRRLDLREHQTVQIEILAQEATDSAEIDAEAEQELEHILQSLEDAGLLTRPAGQLDAEPITDQERRALAEELGRTPGRSLSEIILEDRGEW